jgi:hypothetical protein
MNQSIHAGQLAGRQQGIHQVVDQYLLLAVHVAVDLSISRSSMAVSGFTRVHLFLGTALCHVGQLLTFLYAAALLCVVTTYQLSRRE